jgi:hypothetical protein
MQRRRRRTHNAGGTRKVDGMSGTSPHRRNSPHTELLKQMELPTQEKDVIRGQHMHGVLPAFCYFLFFFCSSLLILVFLFYLRCFSFFVSSFFSFFLFSFSIIFVD